jgi:hypothetical protein
MGGLMFSGAKIGGATQSFHTRFRPSRMSLVTSAKKRAIEMIAQNQAGRRLRWAVLAL